MSSFSHSFTAGIPRLAQHRRWNTWNIISRYWQSRLGEGVWSEQSQKAGQVPISSTEQPPVHPPGPTWPGRMFPTSLAKNRNPCPQSVWCCCLCYRYSVAQPCLTLRSLGLQYSKPPCPSLGALHTCIFIYMNPTAKEEVAIKKVVSLLIFSVSPMLNPFIYTLRNNQVKKAFKDSVKRIALFSSK